MKFKIPKITHQFALLPHKCSICQRCIWMEWYYALGLLEHALGNYGPFRNDIECNECHTK